MLLLKKKYHLKKIAYIKVDNLLPYLYLPIIICNSIKETTLVTLPKSSCRLGEK